MERRRKFCEEHGIQKMYTSTTDNPFSGRIICGKCGQAYGRKVWNSTDDGLRRVVWRCNGKYTEKGKVGCDNRHVDDEVFYKAFIESYNAVVENRERFIEKWKEQLKSDDVLIRVTAKRFIDIFKDSEINNEFHEYLYFKLVEKITVLDEGLLKVNLLDGTEIEVGTG
jgi:site-specific DNA recombinase